MDVSRSRTLYLIICLALAALSLRPESRVESAFEWLSVPSRVLGHLVLPLRWMSARSVRAAELRVVEQAPSEREASLALLAAERAFALPTDPTLRAGRGLIQAQVVEPDPSLETVVIRFSPNAALEPGMPVVCRDTYVGRVLRLDPVVPGEATVALVTGGSFRVGARAESVDATSREPGAKAPTSGTSSGDLVVGGLAPAPEDDSMGLFLAAHVPSARSVESGSVRVYESDSALVEPYSRLADGYRLGELARYRVNAVPVLALRADIDYASGLSQVVVLCPPGRPTPVPELLQGRFAEENWLDGELVLDGDPSFWRESRKLTRGRVHGVADRSAIALGARLVGLVAHAGLWTSDIALLGDPGLALSVLAQVQGEGGGVRPVALGRMVSVGRDRSDGTLLLRWDAAVSPFQTSTRQEAGALGEATGEPVEAVLFTGAGERDVPPGLVIGSARLPRQRGSVVLRVRTPDPVSALRRVRVLCTPAAELRP